MQTNTEANGLPRTKYAHLTLKELIRLHRWDIQHDDLVEELWQRLEAVEDKASAA